VTSVSAASKRSAPFSTCRSEVPEWQACYTCRSPPWRFFALGEPYHEDVSEEPSRAFPQSLTRSVSPWQRSWAFAFKAFFRLEIESCLHASSFLAVAGSSQTARSTSKGCSPQEAVSGRSQSPALLALFPFEVLPLSATPLSFLGSPSHALLDLRATLLLRSRSNVA
jgi:hypothetical protein